MHAGMYQSWCRGRRKGSGSEEWREEEKGEARGRGGSRASGGRLRDLLSEPHPAYGHCQSHSYCTGSDLDVVTNFCESFQLGSDLLVSGVCLDNLQRQTRNALPC